MAYLKFLQTNELIKCSVIPAGKVVTLNFPKGTEPVVNENGFDVFLDASGEVDIGGDSYHGYTTLYRNDASTASYNGYQLSNDGSIYEEPVPVVRFYAGFGGALEGETEQATKYYTNLEVPVPIPDENYIFTGWIPEIPKAGEIDGNVTFMARFEYVPTLEEVQEQKVTEMNAVQQKIIAEGVDVIMTDGTTKHFSLEANDQLSIMGSVAVGAISVKGTPWHVSDEDIHCQYFTEEDLALISKAAYSLVLYHVTYFRDLRIYIRKSLTDKEEIKAIVYGMEIPLEFQSEPLKDMIAAKAI